MFGGVRRATREFCATLREILDENSRLKAENAKLRELASDAHSCKTNDGCCEDCYCDEGCCPVERRMQELGIEVDA